MAKKKIFTWKVDKDGIGWLTIDVPGEKVNSLSSQAIEQINTIFKKAEDDSKLRAVVFISGKPDNFIAGADVKEIRTIGTPEEAEELSRSGQQIFSKFETLHVPTVAAIHGQCLGGGLEAVMPCTYRIASDDPKTSLGLPEIQLGLIPGGGGTQRLPRLVGLQDGLDMILTGRQVKAKKAKKMGLVDEVVPARSLEIAARTVALQLVEGSLKIERPGIREFGDLADFDKLTDTKNLTDYALEKISFGRNIVFDKAEKMVRSKTGGHYPAPFLAIEAIRTGYEKGLEAGYDIEAKNFAQLVFDPVAKQLINLFFAMTETKKDSGVADKKVEKKKIERLGVVGAGLMGAGIAGVSINKGVQVQLKDVSWEALGKGFKYIRDLADKRRKKGAMDSIDMEMLLDNLNGGVDYGGYGMVDLVIEAVFEDLNLKQKVVKEVEQHISKDAIFASNTSALPISSIAKASKRPEQVIGMHFFSPVHKMPLLEIVVTDKTADWVTATCADYGKKIGKTVIVVGDGYGFYTTRILAPYMNEAVRVLLEGAAIGDIDKAMEKFGFPVGPMVLMDEVGIDVGVHVAKEMHEAFGDRMEPPEGTEKVLESGRKGKKNKKGFYTYEGKKKEPDATVYDLIPGGRNRSEIDFEKTALRIGLQMVNEAALCLQDGILRTPRDGDVGAVFGLGFPPFRGGPFRYIDTVGAQQVVSWLQNLEAEQGLRFKPADILVDYAKQGKTFYKG